MDDVEFCKFLFASKIKILNKFGKFIYGNQTKPERKAVEQNKLKIDYTLDRSKFDVNGNVYCRIINNTIEYWPSIKGVTIDFTKAKKFKSNFYWRYKF